MKGIFKIASAYLLVLFMMVSTIGFSINKMICLSSGKTKVAVYENVMCPGGEEAPLEGFNEHCCDYHSQYVQVDYISTSKPLKLPVLEFFLLTVPLSFHNFVSTLVHVPHSFAHGPPVLSGYSLLKLISVFRI